VVLGRLGCCLLQWSGCEVLLVSDSGGLGREREVITQEQLKELLHYCPETGVWTWLVDRKRGVKQGDQAGSIMMKPCGEKYRRIKVLQCTHKAHRLAFLYMTGVMPEDEVDHQDGNGLNNRWLNLRSVTHADNAKNHRLRRNNSSGAAGVCWHIRSGKWQATITVNARKKALGYFRNKEEAIAARKSAEIEFGYHKNHGTDRPL